MQQHWESYVFFYHAKKVQQPGNVTRIVSSCSEAEQAREQQFFDDYILPMRDDGRYVGKILVQILVWTRSCWFWTRLPKLLVYGTDGSGYPLPK